MEIHFLAAAAVGIALMAVSPVGDSKARAEGEVGLVGSRLYASDTRIDRYGDPVAADSLALQDLGTIEDVVTDVRDGAGVLHVSVGGIWGWGAQEVEVGMERVHLLRTADGEGRLVVDLSAQDA